MATMSKKKTCNSIWGALAIIALSVLPFFHDIIATSEGLKAWVPDFGVRNFLADEKGKILGFSSYYIFLYTFLIFLFASIGFGGWAMETRKRAYGKASLTIWCVSLYYLVLIILGLRRSDWNIMEYKLVLIALPLAIIVWKVYKNRSIPYRILIWIGLSVMTAFPFLHDIVTEKGSVLNPWVPDLGIETFFTDVEGRVRGLKSYRHFLYFLGIYLFAHLGWMAWFMSSKGKRYRPFLLVPATLSVFEVFVLLMSWGETEFSRPDIKLYMLVGLSVALAINYYYVYHPSDRYPMVLKERIGFLALPVFMAMDVLGKMNNAMDNIVNADARLNPSDVLQKYVDFRIDDIEEFAATYTYDYHDFHRMLDNKKSKQKMYSAVYDIMKQLEDRGSLHQDRG